MKVSNTVGQHVAGRLLTQTIISVLRPKVGNSHAKMMMKLLSLSRLLFSLGYMPEVITMQLK
jgi:hypothetical protein